MSPIERKTEALAFAVANARDLIKTLRAKLTEVQDATTALAAENVPSITDSIRSNDGSRAIRDGLAGICDGIDRLQTLVGDARAAKYWDQRPTGMRATAF